MNNVFSNLTFFLLVANIFPAIFTYGLIKLAAYWGLCDSWDGIINTANRIKDGWSLTVIIVILAIIVSAIGMIIEIAIEKCCKCRFPSAPKGKAIWYSTTVYERIHSQWIMFVNSIAGIVLVLSLCLINKFESKIAKFIFVIFILTTVFLMAMCFLKCAYFKYLLNKNDKNSCLECVKETIKNLRDC